MRAVRAWWLLGTMIVAGCGGGASPAGPSPQPLPAPTTALVSGHVTATNGGQTLGGVSVAFGATTVTSDGAGAFSSPLPFGSVRVALSGAGILPRSLTAAVTGTRDLPLDAIALGGGFDADFYQQLVRDKNESAALQPLRRWTRAPSVYLQTSPLVDARQLDLVESVAREVIPVWTGGKFHVATIERGSDTRQGVAGWITVQWSAETSRCGLADVGLEGGAITFYPKAAPCGCNGYGTRPRTIRHEFGHAMGFFHTDNANDVMMVAAPGCNEQPSAREQYHAAIAYSRPVGNVDPDADPVSAVLSLPHRVIY